MTLGDRLKQLRTDRDWTLETLARRSGKGIGYLGDIEKGRRKVLKEPTIRQIAAAFNLTVSEFMDGVEQDTPPVPSLPTQGVPPFVAKMIHKLEPLLDEADWRIVAAYLEGLAIGKRSAARQSNTNPGEAENDMLDAEGEDPARAKMVAEEREDYRA